MGAEQSAEPRKSNNKTDQKIYKEKLEEQRKTFEEKLQEQPKVQPSNENNKKDIPQNSTLSAEKQRTYVPLYPNVPQLSLDQMQPSTSIAHNYGYSRNTHNQYKSIFCESSAPMAPMQPTPPEASSTMQQKQRVLCHQTHSSFGNCMIDGAKCGICKSCITNITNNRLESPIEILLKNNVQNIVKANCPNNGCTQTIKLENMQAHLKACNFREMECPMAAAEYSACPWQGKIHQIKNHFLHCHPGQMGVNVDTEICFDLNINYYIINYFAMENYNFLVHVKLDNNLQALLMAVQLIGSPASASKWSYEFHVYEKSKPRKKFTYTDVCLPTSTLFSDIASEAKCVALPLLFARSFFKDNRLTYKFFINKDESIRGPNRRSRSVLPQRVH